MSQETIQIKCPNDGTLLMVKNRPGLENMSLTCPVCKQKMPFSKMIRVGSTAPKREEKGTEYPGQNTSSATENPAAGRTTFHDSTPMGTGMNNFSPSHRTTPPPIPGSFPGSNPQLFEQHRQPSIPGAVGYLTLKHTGERFAIRAGINVIGRRAENSSANVQLPPTPMRRMSREHIRIEAQFTNGSYRFLCSLFKPGVNATYLEGNPLQYGTCLFLQHGNVIALPDCELLFTLY